MHPFSYVQSETQFRWKTSSKTKVEGKKQFHIKRIIAKKIQFTNINEEKIGYYITSIINLYSN
jgi:hypothetical protein